MNKGFGRISGAGENHQAWACQYSLFSSFAHFGIEKDGAELALLYQQHIAQQGQTYAGASELLDSLTEADYEIYGATNGITAIQTGRMAHSDISPYFNHIFISSRWDSEAWSFVLWKIAEQIPSFDKSQTLMVEIHWLLTLPVVTMLELIRLGIIRRVWRIKHRLDQPTFQSYQDLLDLLLQ